RGRQQRAQSQGHDQQLAQDAQLQPQDGPTAMSEPVPEPRGHGRDRPGAGRKRDCPGGGKKSEPGGKRHGPSGCCSGGLVGFLQQGTCCRTAASIFTGALVVARTSGRRGWAPTAASAARCAGACVLAGAAAAILTTPM